MSVRPGLMPVDDLVAADSGYVCAYTVAAASGLSPGSWSIGKTGYAEFSTDIGLVAVDNGLLIAADGKVLWAVDAVHCTEGVDCELWNSVEASVGETGC